MKSEIIWCVCLFQASLTVDSHLSIAMFLQQELNMRAGWRDILRTRSDSCTQPISLVEQKRETAHRRPVWGGGAETQRRVRKKSLLQPSWETTNKTLWLWLVFLFIIHAVTLVDVSCCCIQKYKLIWLQQQQWEQVSKWCFIWRMKDECFTTCSLFFTA